MNKPLGLVGGTSWVSTVDYYRLINEGVNAKLGGNNYATCLIHSFNYGDIQKLTFARDWAGVLEVISAAAKNLIHGGAEGIVLCANTMHVIADGLQERIHVPIIHIAEATADQIVASGIERVALLGTKFTMEMDFLKNRLARRNLSVTIPNDAERDFIHATIFGELGNGVFTPETKQRYLDIIGRMGAEGAQGAILGCTEIPMLLKADDIPMPSYDTTALHAAAAVRFATGT